MKKKCNFPTLDYYNNTITAGEDQCQLLVETAASAMTFSPDDRQYHNVMIWDIANEYIISSSSQH